MRILIFDNDVTIAVDTNRMDGYRLKEDGSCVHFKSNTQEEFTIVLGTLAGCFSMDDTINAYGRCAALVANRGG